MTCTSRIYGWSSDNTNSTTLSGPPVPSTKVAELPEITTPSPSSSPASASFLSSGGWSLRTIDGQSIPATGYRLPPDPKKPLDPPKYLQYGFVYFYTDEAGFDNDCEDLLRSEGTAIASYGITSIPTATFEGINRKSYTGRFHNNHETNAGDLGAGKYQAPMTITSTGGVPSIITVRVSVDIFIADVTYTLVFQR